MDADDDIQKILRDTQPSWTKDGKGVRGDPMSVPQSQIPAKSFTDPNVVSHIVPGPTERFTPAAQAVTDTTQQTVTADNSEYSFELTLASIDNDAFTIDIHIGYGEINDTPPAGMTGADDYIATLAGSADGTEFWVLVTYDTTTLAITSRSIGWGFSVPDSTLGNLYIPFGYVDITYNSITGKVQSVFPHNRHCGDINISFEYGNFNGALALFINSQLGDPQPV